MKPIFSAAMAKAARLTRQQNLSEATRLIQQALTGTAASHEASAESERRIRRRQARRSPRLHDKPMEDADCSGLWRARTPFGRARRPLGDVIGLLRQANLSSGIASRKSRAARVVSLPPDGASWLTRTSPAMPARGTTRFTSPVTPDGRSLPLIVMLHGCTQAPDDFALGTGMNRLAEEQGFIVAYPEANVERQLLGVLELVQREGPAARSGRALHHRRDNTRRHGASSRLTRSGST